MSGAEPWTGSNSDGNARSGLMLPEGAMAMVPVQAGPRSDRMSPKRLEATTTSNQYGMVIEMPLDLVAEVTCFFGRFFASSNANLSMRSTPLREKTDCWKTI